MDQTPLPFEFLDERTYDGLGTQSVQIKKFVWSRFSGAQQVGGNSKHSCAEYHSTRQWLTPA
jgi:hypothetical protein